MGDDSNADSGISPVLAGAAGAAVYAGAPVVAAPIVGGLPELASRALTTGEPITEDFGTPLQRLAEFTREEVGRIRDFAKARGVTVPIVAGFPGQESSYFAMDHPINRLIAKIKHRETLPPHIGLARSSVPQAMHEIGHASPIMGSEAARDAFQTIAHTLGQTSNIGRALRIGLAASVFAPPTDDASSTRKFIYNNAPALVGATMVPQLIEEVRASTNAMRGAREFGPGIGRMMAELAPNFGTYLAGAALPVLGTILAKHVVQALRNRGDGQTKTSAPRPGAEVKAPGALRSSATTAWKVGMNPPKPKTIPPNANLGAQAGGRATAKPPSKTSFYKDLVDTMYNPQRGSRITTPG